MKIRNLTSNNRRGLSSIVGALLFVVLMVATFSVLGVALNSQTDIVDTGKVVAETGLKKQQENFVVTNISQLPGQDLAIYAQNKGPNPTEIFTIVMTNSSDMASGYPTRTFDVPSDTSFLPPYQEDSTDVIKTENIKIKTPSPGETDTYQFKVVSSLGTIKKYNIICDDTGLCQKSLGGSVGVGDLAVQLYLDGPNGVNTKTSTIIMFVSNNGDGDLKDVWPDTSCPDLTKFPLITDAPPTPNLHDFTSCTLSPSPDPDCGDGTGVCLGPGQTMIFKWDGVVSGDVGDKFDFCNSVSGKQLDDTPETSNTDCDSLTVIDPNDCGGCDAGKGGETIILIDDLLIRPSIFMIIPSPMGAADPSMTPNPADKVMFGVNVVNPTNSTIEVSKVIMSVFAPGANNNDKLFYVGGTGCHAENISPLGASYGDSDWSCPGENMLLWKNRDNPVVLNPYSAETFMTQARIDGTGIDLEGVLIQTSVFTSFGSFGKGNYQTTMTVPNSPTMSIYMSPNVDGIATSERLAKRLNINYTDPQTFNIVLADTDTNDQTWLETGSRFIINVPREWTKVNVTGTTGIAPGYTTEVFGDGSTQIIGITDEQLGVYDEDTSGRRAATITFEAWPPSKDVDRLYIMYVLADGEARTANDYLFSSGPLNEIVLQVNSNQTAP